MPGIAGLMLATCVLASPARAQTLCSHLLADGQVPACGSGGDAPVAKVTLGLGALRGQDGFDYVFEAARGLARHPVLVHGAPVQLQLVDYTTDADFQLSGNVVAATTFREPDHTGRTMLITGGIAGGSIVAAGLAMLFLWPSEDETGAVVGITTAAMGGVVMLACAGVALAMWDDHPAQYVREASGDFTLRRAGRRVAEVKVSVPRRKEERDGVEAQDVTLDPTLDPMWEALSKKVSAELEKADAQPGGAK